MLENQMQPPKAPKFGYQQLMHMFHCIYSIILFESILLFCEFQINQQVKQVYKDQFKDPIDILKQKSEFDFINRQIIVIMYSGMFISSIVLGFQINLKGQSDTAMYLMQLQISSLVMMGIITELIEPLQMPQLYQCGLLSIQFFFGLSFGGYYLINFGLFTDLLAKKTKNLLIITLLSIPLAHQGLQMAQMIQSNHNIHFYIHGSDQAKIRKEVLKYVIVLLFLLLIIEMVLRFRIADSQRLIWKINRHKANEILEYIKNINSHERIIHNMSGFYSLEGDYDTTFSEGQDSVDGIDNHNEKLIKAGRHVRNYPEYYYSCLANNAYDTPLTNIEDIYSRHQQIQSLKKVFLLFCSSTFFGLTNQCNFWTQQLFKLEMQDHNQLQSDEILTTFLFDFLSAGVGILMVFGFEHQGSGTINALIGTNAVAFTYILANYWFMNYKEDSMPTFKIVMSYLNVVVTWIFAAQYVYFICFRFRARKPVQLGILFGFLWVGQILHHLLFRSNYFELENDDQIHFFMLVVSSISAVSLFCLVIYKIKLIGVNDQHKFLKTSLIKKQKKAKQ